MVHLAIEIFGLVFAATVCGYVLGYGGGTIYGWVCAKRSNEEDEGEFSEPLELLLEFEPVKPRRIPDPAPPSESRRKRVLDDHSRN